MVSTEGFGSATWWGFSPARDLTAVWGSANDGREMEEPTVQSDCVNVLLVGSGDLRHLLMTMAHAHRHTPKPVHFYVVESSLEVLARHMLFLSLLVEPPDKLGLQEKTELFLELFGNTLVRTQTADYLRDKATDLIKMVTDLDYLKTHIPFLDISALKFKERDLLEGIFKFWRSQEDKSFDISQYWEGRLRHYLGVRYDSRQGVFDWDYNMKLKDMVPIVNSREYCGWREGGVAFQLRSDAPYEATNRTLASGLIVSKAGERLARRGYWGDIVVSPFVSFGVESENKDLFKTINDRHTKTSSDVSEYNLLSLIHLLSTGEKFTERTGPTSVEDMATIEEVPEDTDEEDGEHHTTGPLIDGRCCVTFLPLGYAEEIGKRAKFRKVFNIVYFSNSMVHHLTSGLESVFAPDCTVILETARFMLDLKKEHKDEFVKKITGMAQSIGLKRAATREDPSFLVLVTAGDPS